MTARTETSKRRPNVAALVIAAFLVVIAVVMLFDAARLADMGGYSGVGPASFPGVVAFALIGLAAWTVYDGIFGDFPAPEPQRVAPVVWIIIGLMLQLLLLNVAGFSIATGLMFACAARAFGKRNLALSIPIGIALSFAVWAVFSQILMLNLPTGPLEHLFVAGR
ncbi:tripartite tricarboxylate transporter TctB family protein [Paracoccus caeni]|uniref:Tripartite tricarboxylate transporter TctB family protein n=1 Tax=Paracoccus caeni TaxID=657651 RepID=A0A934SDI9_9RHOB|nr:tripartite tricarboxylate transporter TctB family protein [Paracoccus caeni]MBK4216890.1 tripartite tricarboxylate transporter TctB family protein [Paracoccus caeni]